MKLTLLTFTCVAIAASCTPKTETSKVGESAPPPVIAAAAVANAPPGTKPPPVFEGKVKYPALVASPPPSQRSVIDEAAAIMRERTDVRKFEIVGHQASDEPEGLAFARANLIRSSLVARGIPDERLHLESFKDSVPSKDPAESRRVEFRALSGD